jgi:hypothetical protein
MNSFFDQHQNISFLLASLFYTSPVLAIVFVMLYRKMKESKAVISSSVPDHL